MARLPLVWTLSLLLLTLHHSSGVVLPHSSGQGSSHSSGDISTGESAGAAAGGVVGNGSVKDFKSEGLLNESDKPLPNDKKINFMTPEKPLTKDTKITLLAPTKPAKDRSLSNDLKVNFLTPGVRSVQEILERDAEMLPSQKPRKHKKFVGRNRFPKKHGSRKRGLENAGAKRGAIMRRWGIPDATAVVGKNFRLDIHRNAFKGDVAGYEVSGLPPWLEYSASPPSVRGTPPQSAWGTVWYVRVTARPPAPRTGGATDTFALTVLSPDDLEGGSRQRRSPDYAPGEYPDYSNYDYEYDEYDPTYPDYSGSESDTYDEAPPHVVSTPVYGVTASTVTVSLPRPPTELPRPPVLPTDVVQPSRVVVEASPTAPTPLLTTTAPPHHHFRPVQPTLLIEPTRTLGPSPPATVTSPLPPTSPPPPPPPDVTDHLVRNFPPDVTSRMGKLAWVGGFVYRLRVPEDTFQDLEDGGTRNLRLVLLNSDQSQLSPNSWIQFDPVHQEIYALPLEDLMGHYVFLLEAIDSGGKSVQETVKIHVQQPKQARNFAHRYTATLRIAKKYEYDFKYALDWQVRAVQKIASLFDNRTESINIRSISDNPTKITWTNVTLVDPLSTECPNASIDFMNRVLFGSPEPPPQQTEPLRAVEEHFRPEFHLKRLHVHYSAHCADRHYLPPAGTGVTAAPAPNSPPRFLNQIDIVNATAGQLYRHQVPQDACYDMEDGNSRNLRLRLLTYSLARLTPTSWLQFDPSNQEFYGLPLAADVGSAEYTLECVDSGGSKTNDALTVVVQPSPLSASHLAEGGPVPQPPASFSLTLRNDYTFMATPLHKIALVEKIGHAFGDADGRLVSVWELSPGSVVVRWYNTSLGGAGPCPTHQLHRLHDIMLTPQGAVRPEFSDHFLPEFEVASGDVTPGGACHSPDTPHHLPPPDLGSDDTFGFDDLKESGAPEERPTTSGGEDYLLTFLIPSVLMAAMLVLAAVAACCLYRHRRRYAKMSLTSHAAPPDTTTTFVTTGIPVILAEELDDHPAVQGSRSPAAKTPVIMKDEKPPLPPYRQSPPSPHAPHQQYQPPPPFTNGSSPRNTSLPSQPPAYRKPAYVPP